MPTKKRTRRSINDTKSIMEPYKNTFYGWQYAGDPKTMYELFPDDVPCREGHTEYFSEIPADRFKDPVVVKNYGENLRNLRIKKGWTLKFISNRLGIDFQQLQQIEAGERKRIQRNLLLLFCGIYQTPPEVLMGLALPAKQGMVFYPEIIAKKASFIVDSFISRNVHFLTVICSFADTPLSIQKSLLLFLQNTPKLNLLTSNEVEKIAQFKTESSVPHNEAGEPIATPKWSDYWAQICEIGMTTPELLDVYVSIATDENCWSPILQLLVLAGFVPQTVTDSDDKSTSR